ncbi:MAG: PAS domain S-box protein [Candidatus Heimdallarchaeota archaeon]|nr:PAS domain S-box protein [Candidatus Heimdallarchaeota archaeon]
MSNKKKRENITTTDSMVDSSNSDSQYNPPTKLEKLLSDTYWYKQVIESMADGIIATDMYGKIAFVNPKLCDMLRYSHDELIGNESLFMVEEKDRSKVIRHTEMRYKDKKSSQYEVIMRTKYGSLIPVMISATPILSEDGQTIGTYALVTDIKDRKIVEKELRNKNTELQTLYNNLLQLYQQLGAIIAESTSIHTEILLFTSKDCVYCAPTEEVLQEVLTSYGGKITYRKVDIEKEPEVAEPYDIMSLPTIAIGEEKITGVPDMFKLHSSLFSALVPQEKFRRTRQELDNLISHSPIAIFTINNDGILTSVNPLVELMVGYKRNEIVGQNVLNGTKVKEIFSEDLKKLFKKGLEGENVSVNRLKIKEISANKPELFSIISFKVVPLADSKGEITEILVLSEDVTTLALQEEELSNSYQKMEELNDQLIKMNKDRSDFVEITTTRLIKPLNNSAELLNQILSGQLGEINEEVFGTLEYLRNSVDDVSKSLLDILDFSALELQEYTLKLGKHNIKEIISEALKTIGSVVIDKGFIVSLSIPDSLSAWCDFELVIRILKNLIINAIKFTENDCNIEIIAKSLDNNFVEISITDNGIGLKKEDLERIFDQYVKVDPKSSGSGLGLSVVKALVKAHFGSIVAESEGLSKGSTFRFTLPQNKKSYEILTSIE